MSVYSKRAYLVKPSSRQVLPALPRGDFRIQTSRIRSRARVGGGGKAWMAPNVYQAYRARRDAITKGIEPLSKSEIKRVRTKKLQQKQLKYAKRDEERARIPAIAARANKRTKKALNSFKHQRDRRKRGSGL
jgi:hypothetical protein